MGEQLDPMGRATMDLMSAYAINSLFWMLLKTMGVNPAESGVKQELGRVQEAMKRCKEIKDREERPSGPGRGQAAGDLRTLGAGSTQTRQRQQHHCQLQLQHRLH